MANDITAKSVLNAYGSAPKGEFDTFQYPKGGRYPNRITPVNDRLYLAAVTADNKPPKITLEGTSLDWVQIGTAIDTNANQRLTVFRAMKTSGTPVPGYLVAKFGGHKVNHCSIIVAELNFVDTSGTNGSGAIVQSVIDGANTSQTAVQVADVAALAAFGDPLLNAAFGITVIEDAQTPQPPDGYTDIDSVVTDAGMDLSFQVGQDTRVITTWDTAAFYLYFAAEIKSGSAKKRIDATLPDVTPDEALSITPRIISGGDSAVDATTLAGLVKRVGEKLSLAYDRPGYERNMLHDFANEAVEEVLIETHCYLQIGDTVTLTTGVAEYRLPAEILAIDDGRGSTPAGIGQYEVITLSEMIDRQSAAIVTPTFRKAIAIEGNLLVVSPTPETSETLRFYYVPKPSQRMAADTDDITSPLFGGLPSWARRAVEAYMLWQAADYDDKATPKSPQQYQADFEAECKKIRSRLRRMRSRTVMRARIGYPETRRPYGARNDQYPSPWVR